MESAVSFAPLQPAGFSISTGRGGSCCLRGVAAGFSAGRGEHPWNPALLIIQVLAKGTASGKWRPSLLWRSPQGPIRPPGRGIENISRAQYKSQITFIFVWS